jgi:hypothetical protein
MTVELDGTITHIDNTLDPANPKRRERLVQALIEKHPALDRADVEAQLLNIASQRLAQTQAVSAPVANPVELDISRIIRPEQFITVDVCGVTVPVVIDMGDKPMARWMMYLRWADGRRECRGLVASINVANGARLWIHPTPGDPSMTMLPAWSAVSRRAWLENALAPNPADVFRSICEGIAHFVDFPDELAAGTTATLALWSMLTYCYQAWDAVPYLHVGGPLGSGKTRVFELLAQLAFRPLQSSNLTAPAMFRTLHDRGGALLFDEAERLRQSTPEVSEILSMLLAGYKRGGQATRLEAVGDSFRPVAFDVYGPKALACITGLPPALSSRCISLLMFRAAPNSPKPKRRIDAELYRWKRLRDDLHTVMLEHGMAFVHLSRLSSVCPTGVDGRAYELWQPILALASWVESHGAAGLLNLMQRHALASNDTGKDDQISDADETLLELLADKIRMGGRPTPGEICAHAKELDRATFDRWTPRTVSNHLKSYGIVAQKVDRRREYRSTTMADLLRIQTNYNIDLGISYPESSSLASRCVPESPVSGQEILVSGRNGTKRDAS